MNKKIIYPALVACSLYFLSHESALAVSQTTVAPGGGGGGSGLQGKADVFNPLYKTLVAWTDGPLGKFIALLAIIIGIAAGIMRQSLTAVVIGLGAAIIFANAPTIIDAIMGTTQGQASLELYDFWQL
ncbi:TraA family conjugative transfer protein [Psittacicella gerlachiana]|uniref:Uncharacterized protein n=1 Tax=Psittacicella gerlachiana TaxID=2028574 RepID=A0A3A1YDX4_9GAMM|nr:TraA family conjugative transfer protein [Psittacicella gerlachiana]RIY35865.1 hypothetical protein CKF59_03130 [Psittacicella gerlachiana]